MCEYCGCRAVPLIGELMYEHDALLDQAVHIRHALLRQRWDLAAQLLDVFSHLVRSHVAREEAGVFRALRDAEAFVDEVVDLEADHVDLDLALSGLDPLRPEGLQDRFDALVRDLTEHIEREDLGVFPVAVVSLGAGGWATVERAHAARPSFLPSRPAHG